MIAIVDYGVGNLFSLQSSLAALGVQAVLTKDAGVLDKADKVILPGVGAFGDAAQKLRQSGMEQPVKRQAKAGKPLLGICLGMQLLFDESSEFGAHEGLGLVPGRVVPLAECLAKEGFDYKVPHLGWNPLRLNRPQSPLLARTKEGDAVYYVHSFCAVDCAEYVIASSEYGVWVTGAVQRENVYGTQFHPEKSGGMGLDMLRAFAEI